MNTATEAIMKQDKKARDTRMFEAMMESFLKHWMPEDHYDAMEFERQLHMLVRQIYRDAQEPLLDHISKIAMAAPVLPTHLWPKS